MKRKLNGKIRRDRGRTRISALGRRTSICIPAFILSVFLLFTSCNSIDEDLSNCGNDYELNYELMLVTNLTTELHTELTAQADIELAADLRKELSNIFSDFAHDVDLSFYDNEGERARLQHDKHVMDANQASYTLYLPMREYKHLAVANIVNNHVVDISGDEVCYTSQLRTINPADATRAVTADTIDSHDTGLFSARLLMDVLEGVDQTFDVHLFMVNCASALVIDTTGVSIKDMKVYTTGFATSFNLEDSTFVFTDPSPVVRTSSLNKAYDNKLCYYSVNFPSHEEPVTESKGTRVIIDTADPFVSVDADDAIWEIHCYVTLTDGSVTKTVLGVRKPLRAGQLKIINVKIDDQGVARPTDSHVGVSVTLDWNPIDYSDIPLGD